MGRILGPRAGNGEPAFQQRGTLGALSGREFDLLLEGESEESELLLEGRTAMHAPEIDGKVFINEFPDGVDPKPGEFYRCLITEAHDYDLVAKIV